MISNDSSSAPRFWVAGDLKDRKFNALTWDIAGGLRMSN